MLRPYLASLPSIVAAARAIHKGLKVSIFNRVKDQVAAEVAKLKSMYPNDYMAWALPGAGRSLAQINRTTKNVQHQHIPAKTKEVFEHALAITDRIVHCCDGADQILALAEDAAEDASMYVIVCQVVNITVRQPEVKNVKGNALKAKAVEAIKALKQKGRWEAPPSQETIMSDSPPKKKQVKKLHDDLKAELMNLADGNGHAAEG